MMRKLKDISCMSNLTGKSPGRPGRSGEPCASETKMGDFRTFANASRVPAVGMKPLVDPAGWSPERLGDVSEWSYRITDEDAADIAGAVAAFRKTGAPAAEVNRDNFPLGKFS